MFLALKIFFNADELRLVKPSLHRNSKKLMLSFFTSVEANF